MSVEPSRDDDSQPDIEPQQAQPVTEPEPPQPRRPRPAGARCDACHERGARIVRTRDGLLTVCSRCARGVDVATSDSADAITAVVNRAPLVERRALLRRLLARRALHTARRARNVRRANSAQDIS